MRSTANAMEPQSHQLLFSSFLTLSRAEAAPEGAALFMYGFSTSPLQETSRKRLVHCCRMHPDWPREVVHRGVLTGHWAAIMLKSQTWPSKTHPRALESLPTDCFAFSSCREVMRCECSTLIARPVATSPSSYTPKLLAVCTVCERKQATATRNRATGRVGLERVVAFHTTLPLCLHWMLEINVMSG